MNHELETMYRQDLAEHLVVPPVGTREYRELRSRDRQRRIRAQNLLRQIADPDSSDLYHAAWLFNHGDDPEEARAAHELASRSAQAGHVDAMWLAAASYDRWCMYRGLKQKFGTQIVPDGTRYRLWDVEPDTTDEQRALFGVPPLAEMHRRAHALSRECPQPDLVDAPSWLIEAIARWNLAPVNE